MQRVDWSNDDQKLKTNPTECGLEPIGGPTLWQWEVAEKKSFFSATIVFTQSHPGELFREVKGLLCAAPKKRAQTTRYPTHYILM